MVDRSILKRWREMLRISISSMVADIIEEMVVSL